MASLSYISIIKINVLFHDGYNVGLLYLKMFVNWIFIGLNFNILKIIVIRFYRYSIYFFSILLSSPNSSSIYFSLCEVLFSFNIYYYRIWLLQNLPNKNKICKTPLSILFLASLQYNNTSFLIHITAVDIVVNIIMMDKQTIANLSFTATLLELYNSW